MAAGHTVTVTGGELEHSDVWRGDPRVLMPAIRAARIPYQTDRRRGPDVFLIPKRRSADLAAALTAGRFPVHIDRVGEVAAS